ncbi:ankyrin repeat domain-containing protein [bacterium]|nr:ankyrin repeat domain-containing protein [bacterium]
MKHLLLTTIAAVVLVGCGGPSKPPDISIHDAAIDGDIEAVKQHLADGVDVNSKSGVGRTPLDVAIAFKQSLITDLLRKHDGKTRDELKAAESIWNAIELGSIEAVKQHLAAGADVNAKDEDGYTPLYAVAGGAHKEIAVLLIANGADVNAKNKYGETPLHYAATKEIAELLIAKGADVNAKDEVESTPLHTAALNGHKEVTELLIDNNADVNAKYEDGGTPLDEANAEIADLLRKHGGKTAAELKAEGK